MVNRNKNKAKFIKGFTLLELIISGAIMCLVSIAVYSVLAGGINIWKKANQDRGNGYGLRLIAEKLSSELRNSFQFSTIPFEGTEDSIAFAALVDNGISRVSYFINEDNVFCHRLQSYSDIFKEGESGKYDLLLADVSQLKFSYCYLDNASGDYKWKDKWVKEEQDTMPQAVKIELTFKSNSEEDAVFSKTIFIPIGTGEQKISLVQ